MAGVKFLNGVDLASQKIVNLADPSAATDGANKQYVDNVARGLDWKEAVRVATTAAGTLATSFENGDSVDGVTLATGDRILIKNQAAPAANGIYTVNASGAPTRALDADSASDIAGAVTSVDEGTTNANTVWYCTADDPVTLESTSLTWSQLGAGTAYTGGSGLTLSGSDFSVNVDSTTIEINSDTLRVASGAAGSGLTGGSGAALAVGAGNGITVNADDVALASTAGGAGLTYTTGVLAVGAGTGITVNADDVAVNTSVVVRKSSGSIGNGSATAIAYTHSLGTKDVTWSLRDNSNDEFVVCDAVSTDTNTLTLTFAVAPTTNQFRVTVHG